MASLEIDPKTSALVLIDLQKGIAARTTAPHSSDAVVKNAARIAERFRTLGATVVLVHVDYSPDLRDMLFPEADAPFRTKDSPALPENWAEFVPEIGPREGDVIITKRQWGAFYGTDLDLQLRRRGVRTIVLGGIATNMGVESTARDAFERGYELIFVEDAMSSMIAEWHAFSVTQIFPRIGRVRSTDEVLAALAQS
jgi:nicotinamidase-related amidase